MIPHQRAGIGSEPGRLGKFRMRGSRAVSRVDGSGFAGGSRLGIPESGLILEAFGRAEKTHDCNDRSDCKTEARQNPEDCECGLHG